MRPSLLPGLLAAAGRNLKRGATSLRLFEIGRRYLADAERPSLGVVLAGNRRPRHWATGKAQGFDAFDAKTEALALLSAAGAPVDNLQVFGEDGAARAEERRVGKECGSTGRARGSPRHSKKKYKT